MMINSRETIDAQKWILQWFAVDKLELRLCDYKWNLKFVYYLIIMVCGHC